MDPFSQELEPPQIPGRFIIDSGKFKILGDEFFIQPISDELVRLHNRLVYLVEHGGRFPEVRA
jgi:hypothetical protein